MYITALLLEDGALLVVVTQTAPKTVIADYATVGELKCCLASPQVEAFI